MNKNRLLIIAFVLVLGINIAEAKPFFEVNLSYNSMGFRLNNLAIADYSDTGFQSQYGQYTAQLISFENKVLNQTYFDTYYTEIINHGLTDEEMKIVNVTEIVFYIPYYSNSDIIVIMDPADNPVYSAVVSQFAKNLCGDGICQRYESAKECPSDCEKPSAPAEKEAGQPLPAKIMSNLSDPLVLAVIAAFAVLIFIIFIILHSKRKKQEALNSDSEY
jgi:hypothetical protein